MNTLDLVLLGVVAVFALWGIWRGFMGTVIGLGGYVAAFIGARMWGPTIGEYFRNTSMIASLERIINENLANIGINGIDPASVGEFLTDSDIGEQIANNPIFKSLFSSGTAAAGGATEILITIVCIALGYLVVFFGIKLAVSLIGLLIKGIVHTSKVLTFTDRVLGLGIGTVIGVTLGAVVVAFVLPVAMAYSPEIQAIAQGSAFSGLFLQLARIFI